MTVSGRAVEGAGRNAIARTRQALESAGAEVTDLTDSNPTRHGLSDPRILESVARHARDAARYAPHPRGDRRAREALAARYGGSPDDYWLTASTSQSYSWLCAILADPGEAIAVPVPGYPLVEPLARLAGVGVRGYRSHYVHPHGWVLDVDSLRSTVEDPAVRAVVAVSPGNPTSAYLGGAVDEMVASLEPRDLPLIVDEVFAPFALDGTARSAAGEDRVVTFAFGGLSKLVCAPQAKLAWIRLSGPRGSLPEVREALDTIADLFLPVSGPVAAALPEILGLADEVVEATRQRLGANLAALREDFADTSFRVRRSEGGWNAVLDVPPEHRAGDLALSLLGQAHLAVHPGWFYDLAEPGALVISLLPRPAEFRDRIAALRTAILSLPA